MLQIYYSLIIHLFKDMWEIPVISYDNAVI